MSLFVEATPILDTTAGYWIRFAETPEEFTAVAELRRRIFRDEQAIVAGDVVDGEDRFSLQALVVVPEGAIGTGRLSPPTATRPEAHIAWVGLLPAYRGRGIGTALMRELLAAADQAEMPVVTLSAQTHALAFYRRLGFLPYGNRFRVRGVEHQPMVRHRPEEISATGGNTARR
jgi:predicted GNAT family N-acyltransferase